MERRPKFKLWDRVERKFFEPIYKVYEGNLLDISITLSGELLRRTLKEPAEHESLFPDRYELIEFTGLTDKNGKEIYEGDIIVAKIVNRSDTQIFNGTVVWGNVSWCIEFLSPRKYVLKRRLSEFHEIEILGNIYENSESLK